jgi:hypothetical protein
MRLNIHFKMKEPVNIDGTVLGLSKNIFVTITNGEFKKYVYLTKNRWYETSN